MKARVQKSGITLSVGMIVKNEESRLEKCLAALSPLLDAVPSELVIVDTGSTDKTAEIAKRFTDSIFHFDWINDFAAARNFGLEKCSGEWFMYLDADEVFDDLSEMIAFFKDPAALQKYNSASYEMLNYTDPSGANYTTGTMNRIVKIRRGLCFVNPVHESLSEINTPLYQLKTVAHHWGYAYESEDARESKRQRNVMLLHGELEKTPDNLNACIHLLNEIDEDERARLFQEILGIVRRNPGDIWAPASLARYILYSFEKAEGDLTLSLIDEYFTLFKDKKENLLSLDLLVCKGSVLKEQGKLKEAAEAFKLYFRYYDLYKAGELDITGLGSIALTFCDPARHEQIKNIYGAIKTHQENQQMKTNIALNQSKTASCDFDKNIVLSVSMIVKNEEHMLSACLEGIKPLLEAIPSELIIIDTGSSDKTVEIAKKYTDKIFHFDWVNDFAAARNFGLEKCRGQWFMFLDADDHFQDVSDMIEFFSNEKIHREYNTAYYVTRNFMTMKYDQYFNFYAHRITRRTDDLHFEGAIHEYFKPFYNPAYYFNSYAHHFGYAFETVAQQKAKAERNLSLLEKELEKDPDNLRTIGHIIGSMVDMDDKKRKLVERALVLSDKLDTPVSFPPYFTAYAMYHDDGDLDKALATLDKVFKKAKPENGVLTEAYACKGWLLYDAGRYAEAEENIKKYLEYLARLEKGELDKSAFTFLIANYSAPEKRHGFVNMLAQCISKQGRAVEALAVYDNAGFEKLPPGEFRDASGTVYDLVINAKGGKEEVYKKLVSVYENVLKTESEEKINYFEQALERLFYLYREEEVFAGCFKDAKGMFSKLMQVYEKNDAAALEDFINDYHESKPLPEGYSAAIELAVKLNVSLGAAIAKMNLELIRAHLAIIAQNNTLLPMQAISYRDEQFYFQNVKNLLFGALLFEAACFNTESLNPAQQSVLYNNYVSYASLYVGNVYNPELLNEDDISVLPESHRFGYHMGAAKKLLAAGDRLGYVRELKKALASCNSMQNVIKYLIEEFSSTL
jgi:glycosyltransferase involved in cell wall biosynthesis